MIEDPALLRGERLIECPDGRFRRLQCLEPRRQELLHPVEPVEHGRIAARLQRRAELAFLLLLGLGDARTLSYSGRCSGVRSSFASV